MRASSVMAIAGVLAVVRPAAGAVLSPTCAIFFSESSQSFAQGPPSQVLITTTSADGELTVSWTTMGSDETPEFVTYSANARLSKARNATSTSSVFDDSGNVAPRRIHQATLTGLAPNAPVYYTLAGNETVYSATYAPQRAGGKVYAVFADFGYVDDYALSTLLADSAAGVFDAVVFGGDFAYDLQDSNGAVSGGRRAPATLRGRPECAPVCRSATSSWTV